MYYPYLRGRQFELIALREFANEKDKNVIPIIEPVRASFNSFKLAIPLFVKHNLKFALILNPKVGDLSENNDTSNINLLLDSLKEELSKSTWIPTFIVNNNYLEISTSITQNSLSNVMLICSKSTDSTNNDFKKLVTNNVTKIVSSDNRSLKRAFRNINHIRLNDNFNAQKRNSDYLQVNEEKFTEENIFFKEDGYIGFADYTPLNGDYAEGGSTPYSVAIHLTYRKSNNEIWIRHFTSESDNDTNSNIQAKFAEAAKKAIIFANNENLKTNAITELSKYFKDKKYPGLGMVKKISIKNHLELMNVKY